VHASNGVENQIRRVSTTSQQELLPHSPFRIGSTGAVPGDFGVWSGLEGDGVDVGWRPNRAPVGEVEDEEGDVGPGAGAAAAAAVVDVVGGIDTLVPVWTC